MSKLNAVRPDTFPNQSAPAQETNRLVFDALVRSSPDILIARNNLLNSLNNLKAQGFINAQSKAISLNLINDCENLIVCLSEFSNQSYLNFAGKLMFFREGQGIDLETELQSLLNIAQNSHEAIAAAHLTKIYENMLHLRQIEDPNKYLSENIAVRFVEDTILLMRCVCPQAINVIDPINQRLAKSFDARHQIIIETGEYDSSVPISRRYQEKYWISKDKIVVISDQTNSLLSNIYHFSATSDKPMANVLLLNGESVVVGRNLELHSLYGLVHPEHVMTVIKAGIHINDSHLSRAALRIFKYNDSIYLFNSITKNALRATGYIHERTNSLRRIDYYGALNITDDNHLRYGQARHYRLAEPLQA